MSNSLCVFAKKSRCIYEKKCRAPVRLVLFLRCTMNAVRKCRHSTTRPQGPCTGRVGRFIRPMRTSAYLSFVAKSRNASSHTRMVGSFLSNRCRRVSPPHFHERPLCETLAGFFWCQDVPHCKMQRESTRCPTSVVVTLPIFNVSQSTLIQ